MGCVYRYPGPVEIHHILGASATEYGIPVGHLAILPVSNQAHREIERLPKTDQIRIFMREVLKVYWHRYNEVPLTAEEILAIATWSR